MAGSFVMTVVDTLIGLATDQTVDVIGRKEPGVADADHGQTSGGDPAGERPG